MARIVQHDTIAAFDLGSNTIKMTVARNAGENGAEEFLWRSETVRLGQNIEATGELARDRVEAALDTLRRFADEARAAGATRLVGVATEATRVARNGPAFLDMVRDQTGIDIQSIDGDQEAKFTFFGLDGVVDLDGKIAVADVGGGSTELILASDRAVEWARSFPLGSGRLTDRFVLHDPPLAGEIDQCRDEARQVVASAPLDRVTGGRLIVVGGTGEYLERLIPEGMPRRLKSLDFVIERLRQIDAKSLAGQLGIPEARARVLPAGIAIAAAVADQMRPATFAGAVSGIRRGLLLKAFAGEL